MDNQIQKVKILTSNVLVKYVERFKYYLEFHVRNVFALPKGKGIFYKSYSSKMQTTKNQLRL